MSPDTSPAAPASSSGETSRRRLLALLGAGGAAGIATLVSGNEARAGHDGTNVFHLGQINIPPGGNPTVLSGGELRVHGPFNVLAGPGPSASIMSQSGHALRILRGDPDDIDSALIVSTAGEGPAVEAIGAFNGLSGVSSNEANADGGPTGAGTGVFGGSGTGIGVHAFCPDGIGLRVTGRSEFSTVGSAVLPAGAESVFVSNPAVTNASHITVTLTGNPGARQVRWVERSAGSGFTVHLSSAPKKLRPATDLTYMIAEPRGADV
jgi:hypothetical protein